MKKFKILFTITIITITFSSISLFAGAPPPPPPPGHNSSGNVPGGGAPIGGGLLILVALGAGYGAKKVYNFNKRNLAE